MAMRNLIKDYVFKELKYGVLFKKRLNKIRRYHELSTSDFESLESELLREHIKNAYNNCMFYSELYVNHGVNISQIQNKDDLKKLPEIQKKDVKGKEENLYIGNRFKHISYTSGTTGSPLKVYYDINCVLNEAAYNEHFRNNAGHRFGQRVVSLRGALDGSLMESFDKCCNILYLSSYHLKQDNAKWYFKKISDFKPNCILAYPSSLETLAMLFRENNYVLSIPLAFTSSETLYPHQQELIEGVLNTKVFDRYGNAERTISLVQNQHKGHYQFPALYSVNEPFLNQGILTTNLINPSFPLIRYVVNDLINFDEDKNVTSIIGRVDDIIITPDGLRVGSAAMSLAFKLSPNLLMAQIIQETIDKIFVNIVVNNQFNEHDLLILKHKVRQKVGDIIDIEFVKIKPEEIHKSASNKYKLILNKVV
jgi:phenylacetate-CoA ligase